MPAYEEPPVLPGGSFLQDRLVWHFVTGRNQDAQAALLSTKRIAGRGIPAYFMNLSMAEQRSSMASSSPAVTASTIQWRI